VKRGEIWRADLGAYRPREQTGQRPVVIWQSDALTSALQSVLVVPLTTNLDRAQLASTAIIHASDDGLTEDSVALAFQMRAIPKTALVSRIRGLTALWGASVLSSMAALASIGCGGDGRLSAGHLDRGTSEGQSTGGAPDGGNSGSSDDSGAGRDSAGGGPAGGEGGSGGRDTSQHATNYDGVCGADGQCVLVNDTSDACGCDTCLNASVTNIGLISWTRDREAFNCQPIACPGLPCPEMLAACANGKCSARKPFIVDASNYDTACSHDSGCTTIPVGEMCSFCQCALGAVSLKGLKQYKDDKAKVSCMPSTTSNAPPGSILPNGCNCAPMGSARCSLSMDGGTGMCVMSVPAMTN
jgi:mRNA interferase MazF